MAKKDAGQEALELVKKLESKFNEFVKEQKLQGKLQRDLQEEFAEYVTKQQEHHKKDIDWLEGSFKTLQDRIKRCEEK